MRSVVAVVACLLCATSGCIGAGDDDAAPDVEAAPADGPAATDAALVGDAVAPPEDPGATVQAPVVTEGVLGPGVMACVQAPQWTCAPAVGGPLESGIFVRGFPGPLVAVSFVLTWGGSQPGLSDMGFGLMTMTPGCEDCPRHDIGFVQGPGPLAIEAQGLAIDVTGDAVLHAYVFAAGPAAGPLWTEAGGQREFRIEGTVTAAARGSATFAPEIQPAD